MKPEIPVPNAFKSRESPPFAAEKSVFPAEFRKTHAISPGILARCKFARRRNSDDYTMGNSGH